ncbi:hypothetical protein L596_030232 [Steinernema carpocapsae]|uniref:Nuclear receptor domain-containing protein n=1 Tax=Steinernema carpocapsae TaxID=34508 RepID=A0A4U5LS56_STECR|nr:hypothetical protein L596_030232 [Steinernema carpocapsae]
MRIKTPPQSGVPRMGSKYCVVCGAEAKCFHYDALTCNSCKIFFRRTLVFARNYVCMKDGRCPIKNINRKFCKYCRLAKCLAVGMNVNSIYIEDDHKRLVFQQNLTKPRTAVDYLGKSVQLVAPSAMALVSTFHQILDHLLNQENYCNRVRFSNVNPLKDGLQYKDITYFLNTPCCFENFKNLQTPSHWPIKTAPLSQDEYCNSLPYYRPWLFLNMVLAIEFGKNLNGFQSLPCKDQIQILRSVVATNRLFTEAYFSFKLNSDSVVFPNGIKALDLLKNVRTNLHVEVFKNILQPLIRYGISKKEYVLCKAIINLHAENPNISQESSKTLRVARQKYTDVLLRLCQNHHGDVEGAVRFGNLLGLIQSMQKFGEKFDQLRELYWMTAKNRPVCVLTQSLFHCKLV